MGNEMYTSTLSGSGQISHLTSSKIQFQSTPKNAIQCIPSWNSWVPWAGLVDQLCHFYLSAIRLMLEYCYEVWHHGLTKVQVKQPEAVQRGMEHPSPLIWDYCLLDVKPTDGGCYECLWQPTEIGNLGIYSVPADSTYQGKSLASHTYPHIGLLSAVNEW